QGRWGLNRNALALPVRAGSGPQRTRWITQLWGRGTIVFWNWLQKNASRRTITKRKVARRYSPLGLEALERRDLMAAPLHYDFGTATSSVPSGYTRVTPATTYNATAGYGWQSGQIYGSTYWWGSNLAQDLNYTKDGTF